MRWYHIFKQVCRPIDYTPYYKWLPYKHIYSAYGTKELYECFGDCNSIFTYTDFEDSFEYDTKPFRRNYGDEIVRYVIIDDLWNIRDYFELTKKYRKKKTKKLERVKKNRYGSGLFHESRYCLTPQEIKEIKYEYGMTFKGIKPKNRICFSLFDDYPNWRNISKSWKDQSKRKKQYKERR